MAMLRDDAQEAVTPGPSADLPFTGEAAVIPAAAEAGPDRVPPAGLGLAECIALVVLYVGISTVPTIISALLHAATGRSIPAGWQILLLQVIAGAVLIPLGVRWSGLSIGHACPTTPYPNRLLPGIVLAGFGLCIVLGELESWLPGITWFAQLLRRMGSPALLPAVLAAWIVAPVLEELLCRGVMLRGLRVRRSATYSIVASALLWAALHMNPWQAFVALPLGLAYGWVSLRTRSLLPTIMAHAVHNATAALLLVPTFTRLALHGRPAHLPAVILLPGVAAAAAGCALVWVQLRGRSPAGDDVHAAPSPPAASGTPRDIGAKRLVRAIIVLLALITTGLLTLTSSRELLTSSRTLLDRVRRRGTADELAGCYRLGLPAAISGRVFPGAAPPVTVRLTKRPYHRSIYLVDVLNQADGSAAPPVYWVPGPRGQVSLHAERAGIELRLAARGRLLAGEAWTYPDSLPAASVGAVTARRVPCPTDPTRRGTP